MTNHRVKSNRVHRKSHEEDNSFPILDFVVLFFFFGIIFALVFRISPADYTIEIKPDTISGEAEIATITNYSEFDSCHYPTEGGCLTKSGTIATEGRTAACPRTLPIGTVIDVAGHQWICEDWYNADLSRRFDLFVGMGLEAHYRAIEFGARKMAVIIYK